MIDTVKFWLDSGKVSEGNPFDILRYLSDVTEKTHERRGCSYTGRHGDFNVRVFKHGISLIGSLAKYYLGDNIQTLTRRATQEAIEKMSDQLHTDISTAKVTRLDVSTIIPTKRPPCDYYRYLGQKQHFTRLLTHTDTLTYQNTRQQLVFYDKIKEAKAKDVAIPDGLDNNLLRYEVRYTRELQKQFRQPSTGAMLYDEVFYTSLVHAWRDHFKTIQKLKQQIYIDMETIKKPSDITDHLAAMYLHEKGQGAIDEILADLRAAKVFTHKKYYTRTKSNLNSLIKMQSDQKNELITELENKICSVAKYAR